MITYKPVIFDSPAVYKPLVYEEPQIIISKREEEEPVIYDAPLVEKPILIEKPVLVLKPKAPVDASISFKDLLEREGIKIRVTSEFRPGAMTASKHRSNHSRKDQYGESMALDIVPMDGNFERLATQIYSNPRVVSWLKLRGYGILEETTPQIMKKTHATGKHFHVGPDSSAVQMTLNRLKNYNRTV